jgi:chromosomal replication initiator protein
MMIPADSAPSISIREVQQTVARAFNLTVAEMLSPSRTQHVTHARHVAMYLSREVAARRWRSNGSIGARVTAAPPSFPRIGIAFARNHSSVIHAYRIVQRRMRGDLRFATLLERLAREARNRAATAAVRREAA